ncbi:MAG: CPBP family intramembrane metalloprotease [Eggerthellaceae bacterium]|nr:CPBP family intramembrane metalloprotease [Eggerthellaceae bacterium]
MAAIRKKLASHRVATYCIITFALTWCFWFAVVYPQALPALAAGEDPLGAPVVMLAVGAGMFFPAIGVAITRLLSGEGFRNAWIKPRQFRRTWKYYVAGWFGPTALVALGAVGYFLLFPANFDPSMTWFKEAMESQLAAAGQPAVSESELSTIAFVQLALVPIAPALNVFTCFGEEWGWRGYLLPHMLEKRSATFTIVVSGIIWGLWHAPITVLGHNYGLGYPGWPVLGIFAMCCFTIAVGSFFSWLALRAKSCLPAVFAHGALNGCANAPALVALVANPFIGPAPTGVIGGIGFIVAGAACLVSLRRSEGRRTEAGCFARER